MTLAWITRKITPKKQYRLFSKQLLNSLWVGLLVLSIQAQSETISFPQSLSDSALSEKHPFVIEPISLKLEQFKIEWEANRPSFIDWSWVPGSLEWVRLDGHYLVPRALLRLSVQAQGSEISGEVSNGKFNHVFTLGGTKPKFVDLPVVLLTGPENKLEISWVPSQSVSNESKNGMNRAFFYVAYQPNGSLLPGSVALDHSCSRFSVEIFKNALPSDSWAVVTCRMVQMRSQEGLKPSLQLGILLVQSRHSHHQWYEVSSGSNQILIGPKDSSALLAVSLPTKLKSGFIGLGVGPYSYIYQASDLDVSTYAPVVTLYGSYAFHEGLRAVIFNATSIHRHFYSDTGVYLLLEQFRILDDRFQLNLLLGGHGLLISTPRGGQFFRTSAPQGAEVLIKDLFVPRYQLSLGSFYYPPIGGRSYYNMWVRYGTSGFFGELNYIGWKEPDLNGSIYSRSVGLSIGFPVAAF